MATQVFSNPYARRNPVPTDPGYFHYCRVRKHDQVRKGILRIALREPQRAITRCQYERLLAGVSKFHLHRHLADLTNEGLLSVTREEGCLNFRPTSRTDTAPGVHRKAWSFPTDLFNCTSLDA